jgi:hypothetical protein
MIASLSLPFTGVIFEVYDRIPCQDLEEIFYILPNDIFLARIDIANSHMHDKHFLVQPGQFDLEDPEVKINDDKFLLPYFWLRSKPFNIGIDNAWTKTQAERLVKHALREREQAFFHGWVFDPAAVPKSLNIDDKT